MKIVHVSALLVMPFYWLSLCDHIFMVSGQCLHDQKSLLLQLKNNLTLMSDSKRSFWNASDDCCNWAGVICDMDGHVTDLYFSPQSISGRLDDSSALFDLQYLESFIASNTNLAGAIPHSIGKMRNLSTLDLSYCGFSGTIPNSLSSLTKLSYLDLSNNNFTGPIISFGMAKELATLYLSHNDLSGTIPSSYFEGLHNLDIIDLSYNSFTGSIPSSLFTLPRLDEIQLSNNQFSQVDEFINVSSSRLDNVDLSSNNLSGPLPKFIFMLSTLICVQLSSNKFNGSIQLDKFSELKNLTILDLSHNNLSVIVNVDPSSFHSLQVLLLASCNLKTVPSFLINQSSLNSLDISDNQIRGTVPNWIWKLEYLNISHNLFTDFEGSLQNLSSKLNTLDLHCNKLQGPIPVFRSSATTLYLDFSSNKFSSLIPQDMGDYMYQIWFLSLSNNSLHGSIPDSFCYNSYLQVLDLSINKFSGTIPSCLMMSEDLEILNLKNNNLSGYIPDTYTASCELWTLNLHGNQLHGKIPKSLAFCPKLEVLDLGSNQITGGFPCFLNEISTLRVLVLRSNKFHGSLKCSKGHKTWEMLQIVDIAFNNFSGKLPGKYFPTWKGYMMHNKDDVVSKHILQFKLGGNLYYQGSVTVVSKGLQMELVKILTIFTSIDFSSNHFEGPIPEELMDFKELYILNLSNNAFSGKIPSSIGNLGQLESLDLSQNSLSGEIPMQLASLSFLSYLNLSFNHLVGKIPTGTQLQSFSASSFEGNDGLYGPPLTENFPHRKEPEVPPQQECERFACTIDWNFISVELGLVFGHGIVFGSLLIWKRWRIWYWQLVHKILCRIFPQLYIQYETQTGQTYATLKWRH